MHVIQFTEIPLHYRMDTIGWDIENNSIAIAEVNKINKNLAMTNFPILIKKDCNLLRYFKITSHKFLTIPNSKVLIQRPKYK